MDQLSFQSRLREAVSGGRKIWPEGKQSCLLLTYDMDADSSWIMRGLDDLEIAGDCCGRLPSLPKLRPQRPSLWRGPNQARGTKPSGAKSR